MTQRWQGVDTDDFADNQDIHNVRFFFALAFFPSDRGRGVTTNLLIFDFFLVL